MARWRRTLGTIGVMAVVAVAAVGCSASATPGASTGVPASQAPAASAPGTSAPASGAPSVPASAVASPSAPAAQGVTPAPTKRYKCASLITDAEMRDSSGYAEAKLSGDDQSSSLSGQTYCQFFTGSAGISIALSVFTAGDGWDKAFYPLWQLGQITPGAIRLDGIGDGAIYGATTHAGLAIVAGHGVSVIFSDMASGKLKGVDLQAQIAKILTIVAGRV